MQEFNNCWTEKSVDEKLTNVSPKKKEEAIHGFISIFTDKLFENGHNIDYWKDNPELLTQIFQESWHGNSEKGLLGFKRFLDAPINKAIAETGSLEKAITKYPILNVNRLISAQEIPFYGEVINFLNKCGLGAKLELEDEEIVDRLVGDEEEKVDRGNFKEPMSIDPRDDIQDNVKLLLATLQKKYHDKDGVLKPYLSYFKLPTLVDFDHTKRTIINTVKDHYDLKSMIAELNSKFYSKSTNRYDNGYEWLSDLKQRLGIIDSNGSFFKTKNLTNDDTRLIIGFTRSFSKMVPEPTKNIIDKEGNIISYNPILRDSTRDITSEWKNNIKYASASGKNNFFSEDAEGLNINRNSDRYKHFIDTSDITSKVDKNNIHRILEKLNYLGIDFNKPTIQIISKRTTLSDNKSYNNGDIIINTYNYIVKELKDSIDTGLKDTNRNPIISPRVKTFDDLFESRNFSDIRNLSLINNSLNPETQSLMMLTGKGEPQYPASNPSAVGKIITDLNQARDLKEFLYNQPFLNKRAYLNTSTDPLLNIMFDKDGNRYEGALCKIGFASGLGVEDSEEGIDSKGFTEQDRLANDLTNILNNTYNIAVNSDKGVDWTMQLHRPIVHFNDTPDIVNTHYRNALLDEMNAAIQELLEPSRVQYYQESIFKLGHFNSIIGPEAVNRFLEDILGFANSDKGNLVKPETPESKQILKEKASNFVNDPNFDTLIQNYLNTETENYLNYLQQNKIVTLLDNNNYNIIGAPLDKIQKLLDFSDSQKTLTKEQISSIIKHILTNFELVRLSQNKLIFGNLSYYKDPWKRFSMWNGMKVLMNSDSEVIKDFQNRFPRTDNRIDTIGQYDRTTNPDSFLKRIVYKDPLFIQGGLDHIAEESYKTYSKTITNKDSLEKYLGARFSNEGKFEGLFLDKRGKPQGIIGKYALGKEADSESKFLIDKWWEFRYRISDMSSSDFKLMEYDRAFEISDIGHNEVLNKYFNYSSERIKEADGILEKYNHQIPLVSQGKQKTQFAGHDKEGNSVGDKDSTAYWCRRNTKGKWCEQLYIELKKQGIDKLGFESGSKFGTLTDASGKLTSILGLDGKWSGKIPEIQDLYPVGLGQQVEFPEKDKVAGTQFDKQVLSSSKDEETKDALHTYRRESIEKRTNQFIKDCGISFTESGLQFKDARPIQKKIRTNLIKAGFPDNQVEAVQVEESEQGIYKIKLPFDILSSKDAIENALWKTINADIITPKKFGIPALVSPMFMNESYKHTLGYIDDEGKIIEVEDPSKLDEKTQDKLVIIRNAEHTQRIENNKVLPMEAIIPWSFSKMKHPETNEPLHPRDLGLVQGKDGLWRDTKKIQDPRIFEFISYRIPTPERNSISYGKGIAIHDPSEGQIVSVPFSEYVRMDKDNDGDKDNMILYNTKIWTKDFASLDFIKYLDNHLKSLGYNESDLAQIHSKFGEDEFNQINNATWTSKGQEYHGVDDNIEDMAEGNAGLKKVYSDIKKGLQSYNQKFKGNIILKIIDDDSIKGIDNKIIDSQIKLLQDPDNFTNLMSPITVDSINDIAEDIRKKLSIKPLEGNYSSYNQLQSSQTIRQLFLTARSLVGIFARAAAKHTLFESIGGEDLTGSFLPSDVYFMYTPARKFINTLEPISILPILGMDKDGLRLGKTYDSDGRYIGQNITSILQAILDYAKNPALGYCGVNKITASTASYLIQMGMSFENMAYFLKQPIIAEYANLLMNDNSMINKALETREWKSGIYRKLICKYIGKEGWYTQLKAKYLKSTVRNQICNNINNEVQRIVEDPKLPDINLENLQKYIKFFLPNDEDSHLRVVKFNVLKKEREFQVAILYYYLNYSSQAQKDFNVTQAINVDTARLKTFGQRDLQSYQLDKVKSDNFISNIDRIMDKTFLGSILSAQDKVVPAIDHYFISQNNLFRGGMDKMLNRLTSDNVFMMNDDKKAEINRYQSFRLNYIIQTIGNDALYTKAEQLLFGDESYAKQLAKFQEKYKDKGSIFLQNMQPLISQQSRLGDSLRMMKMGMSAYDINEIDNAIISEHKQLGNKDEEYRKFLENIATFSLLQTGMQPSRNSIQKVIPHNLWFNSVKQLLDWRDSNIELDDDLIDQQYFQNNYNSELVKSLNEKEFIKDDKNPNLISIDSDNDKSQLDYLKKITRVSKGTQRQQNKKGGLRILNDIIELYKRVGDISDRTYYRRITPLGKPNEHIEVAPFEKNKSIYDFNNRNITENYNLEIDKRLQQLKGELQPDEPIEPTVSSEKVVPLQEMNNIKGINISTKSIDKLGRALTNPTWGSLKDGVRYFDVETAYKKAKVTSGTSEEKLRADMNTMYKLINQKFIQNPELVQQITDRGGVQFLEQSSHIVGIRGSRWEGQGKQSNFIKVLIKSYENAIGATPSQGETKQDGLFNKPLAEENNNKQLEKALQNAHNQYLKETLEKNPKYYIPYPENLNEQDRDRYNKLFESGKLKPVRVTPENYDLAQRLNNEYGDMITDNPIPGKGYNVSLKNDYMEIPTESGYVEYPTDFTKLYNDFVKDKISKEDKEDVQKFLEKYGLQSYLNGYNPNQLSLFEQTQVKDNLNNINFKKGTC